MKRRGLWWKIPTAALALVLAAVLGYLCYALLTYYRVEDWQTLTVNGQGGGPAETDRSYKLLSYNIGFGAYSPDYGFFMDGGDYSRAFSEEAARANVTGALETAAGQAPDFVFLQEVDADATRSYHVDEQQMAAEALGGDMAWVSAQNYDSPYLLWPLTCPHGASRSGIMTFSACEVTGSVRRSLPVETGLTRYLDLDRCYTVTRVPVADGRELCLYNVHLSAYTSDGTVATEQVKLLAADMAAEYAAGNYAVCGGDFNKDLWEDSAAVFGVAGEGQTWAQPFPEELLSGGIRLEVPDAGAANPVPSCRNADGPYVPGESFVLTVDGFLVSENVTVEAASVVDTGFAWSDHNPVLLTFRLEP